MEFHEAILVCWEEIVIKRTSKINIFVNLDMITRVEISML